LAPGPFWGGIGSFNATAMEFVALVAEILLVWFVIVAVTGWLARRRGRDGGLWAVIALFTGPFALAALLLKPRLAPRPEAEAERLADAPPGEIRLLSDSQLELDVAGRLARLRGGLAARINGRPSFELAASGDWQWSDGTSMTDEERAELRREVPRIGRHSGWILTLDAHDRE
jgi:hypothetical protein